MIIMTKPISHTILINSNAATIWEALTTPNLMKQWMGEPEMQIEISSDWKVNGPIVISGFHHIKFENKGTILQFEPNSIFKYSHVSSVSRLPDKPESYSVITFTLIPLENQTSLTVTISNFPTETIYKHLDFYWKTTIALIKNFVEKS
jgi:uncharacterized protein YndB with AHSA1/START domain